METKDSAVKAVRDIRRQTRRKFSAEEKMRIVLEGTLRRVLQEVLPGSETSARRKSTKKRNRNKRTGEELRVAASRPLQPPVVPMSSRCALDLRRR